MNKDEVKGFYDWTAEELDTSIKLAGTVQELEVVKAGVATWDDGRPHLDISTRIVGGDYDGLFGPRHTLTLGESTFEARGKLVTVSLEQTVKTLVNLVNIITDGRGVKLSNPNSYDAQMLEEIGSQLVDSHFIASIKENKRGYNAVSRAYAMSDPPKGFVTAEQTEKFSLA